MKSSGKILTVFLIIIAVLLISLTAVTMFLLQKEIEKRKLTEDKLQRSQYGEEIIRKELEDLKKQHDILAAKNKEADDKINELLDEIDLEHGLREEMKREASTIKENLEKETKAKTELQARMKEQAAQGDKALADMKDELDAAVGMKRELEVKLLALETQNKALEKKLEEINAVQKTVTEQRPVSQAQGVPQQEAALESEPPVTLSPSELTKLDPKENVELEKIVIDNSSVKEGRVMSVDTDTEFVVINLGSKNGLRVGDILSIYRGKEFLGDIKATRVQLEMAAADILPPLTSKIVRKNDQVVLKPQ